MRTSFVLACLLACQVSWGAGESLPAQGGNASTSQAAQLSLASAADQGRSWLRQLAEQALRQSPQLQEAEANWRAAQQDEEEARGGLWPRLEFSGSTPPRQFGEGNPYGNGTTGRIGATLAYTLFDADKTDDEISARHHAVAAAHARYLQAREQTLYDTVSACLQILKYRRLVELHQSHAGRLQALRQKMEEIVQLLPGRRSELTQTQARLLQAQDNRFAAEAKLREYRIQLVKLVGEEAVRHMEALPLSSPEIALLSRQEALDAARRAHPALLAHKADMLSLQASAEAIGDADWPVLEVQASKMSGTDIMGYSDPGQVFMYFKWNAFQGFAGRARQKALLQRANAAEERYRQGLRDIEFGLDTAWADYQNQRTRSASLRQLATDTEQVRDDYYLQWQELGKRSLLEVLTAENEHLNTLINLSNSEFDAQLALLRLRFESATLTGWLFP